MGLWDSAAPDLKTPPAKDVAGGETAPVDNSTGLVSGVADAVLDPIISSRDAKGKPIGAVETIKNTLTGKGKKNDLESYYGSQINKGFWNFVGNVVEAAKASGKEPLPMTAARIMLGTELVDAVSPYNAAQLDEQQQAALAGKWIPPPRSSKSELIDRVAPAVEAPGPVSDIVGKGLEVMSDPANLIGGPVGVGMKAAPTLGKMVRPAAIAFLSGSGGETGGKAGGSIGGAVGGEEGRNIGTAVGTLAGAILGGNAQDFRLKALSGVADAASNFTKAAVETGKAAFDKVRGRRMEDQRSLWQIFSSNYGDLSNKSEGLLKEHVRGEFASALERDPDAAKSLEVFDQAIKDSGGPSTATWNLAQRATTPALIEETRLRVPQTGEEAAKLARANLDTQKDVTNRYKALTGKLGLTDNQKLVDSLNNLQAETNLKVRAVATEAEDIRNSITHFDLPDTPKMADKGAELRALADAEIAKTKQTATDLYNVPKQLEAQLGVEINPAQLRAKAGEILGAPLASLDLASVPPSVRRLATMLHPELGPEAGRIKELQDMLLTADAPTKLKLNREIADQRAVMNEAKNKNLSLTDAMDISTALNKDAASLAASNNKVGARNLEQMRSTFEDTLQAQLPEVIRDAYGKARAYYRDVHAPRANVGVNTNLQREAGSARAGEEKVIDEQLLGTQGYLNPTALETRMREFDNLFGGVLPGTAKNEPAHKLLGEALENQYFKDLLEKGQIKPENHDAFMRKWNSALERTPDTRQKLEDTFNAMAAKADEATRMEEKWTDVMKHPLTGAFTVEGAKAVVTRALSDPNQMNRLINYTLETAKGPNEEKLKSLLGYIMNVGNPIKGGEYNPNTLSVLLNSGRAEDDRISAMQVLFRRIYGKEMGDKHLDNLQSIAELQKRQAMTDPEFLRPRSSDKGPLESSLGISGSSLWSIWNAQAQGRTSPVWSGIFAAGKFSNLKFSQAIRDLQYDALFDPAASQAVIDMYRTRTGRPLAADAAKQVADRMGSEGKAFMQRLFDTGSIGPVTYQGIRIGAKSQTSDEDRK